MVDDVRLFVVRVWQRLGLFRAVVQPADGGPARLFDHPDDLAHYLGADAGAAPADGGAAAVPAADGSGDRHCPCGGSR